MTHDIPYPYRPHSSFQYLTGLEEPEAFALFTKPTRDEGQFLLWLRPRDASREIWDGPRAGVENGKPIFEADKAFNYYSDRAVVGKTLRDQNIQTLFFDPSIDSSINGELGLPSVQFETPHPILHELRLVKTGTEIDMMRRAADSASAAFIAAMKATKPGVSESWISAVLDFEMKRGGADRMSYPPVVAGGENALILHYITNNQLLKDGDLLLVDAGSEHSCYVSDISRTWPVNGRFSEPQRELYEAVLNVQERLIEMVAAGTTLSYLHQKCREMLFENLVELQIIQNISQLSKVFPHSVGHYLGMDVHDTNQISVGRPLQAGMVITIEPGLYVPNSPEFGPYAGIGIRIEDDVMVTNGQSFSLTTVPKSVEEIEAIMKQA